MTITTDTERKASSMYDEKEPVSVEVMEKQREELNLSEADSNRVRRKVDFILLPFLMTIYGLQFVGQQIYNG